MGWLNSVGGTIVDTVTGNTGLGTARDLYVGTQGNTGSSSPGNDADVNKFIGATGRNPTDAEWKWVSDAWVQKSYGGQGGALAHLADKLKTEADYLRSAASAAGVRDVDANALRDKYLGTSGEYGDDKKTEARELARAELTRLLTEQTTKDEQAKIDAKTNPAVSDSNRGSAANIIKQMYGRDASQDEIEYFGKELAKGTSAYELGQFLTQTPEYQTLLANKENERVKTEAAAARAELTTSLNTQREQAYQKAMPNILSSYMKAGKLNSSGVDSAVAQAQAELLKQQQQYMAGLQYEDAVRQQGYNRQDFLNANQLGYQNQQQINQMNMGQQQALQGYSNYAQYQSPWDSMNRQYQLSDARTARANELQDYYMQQADYNRQMSQNRKSQREAALYGLAGAAIGGAAQGGMMALGRP